MKLWEFPVLARAKVVRCGATVDGTPISWRVFLDGLRTAPACRSALTSRLAGLDADQVFWETPVLSTQTMDRPFEFVATPCGLARPENPAAFQKAMDSGEPVVVFPNLGGDAVLVAPADLRDGANHNYLLSFLRTASEGQVDEFWRAVGDAALRRVSDKPVWVSTSGGGVAWLHVRLDDSPKYYSYAPYRRT